MSFNSEEFSFPAANGEDTISARLWQDDEIKPLFIVQIIHGMCEHTGRYIDFAKFLAANGAIVCGEDHMGHGKSKGKNGYGYFARKNGSELFAEDTHKLRGIVSKRYPELSYFLLGHSMGSFICRDYITKYSDGLSGIILSGTAGPNPLNSIGLIFSKLIILFKGEKHQSKFLTTLAFGSYNNRYSEVRTQYDWITRDTAIIDAYASDEGCTFMFTARGYNDLLKLLGGISSPKWALKAPKDIPYLVFSGRMDPVGGFTKGVTQVTEWLKMAGVKDLTFKLYEDGRHEMLNEINRQEVYNDILQWLEKKLNV